MRIRLVLGKFFSWLFNPLFMPLYGMGMLLFWNGGETVVIHPSLKWVLLAVTTIFHFLLPLVTLLMTKFFGFADSLELPVRRQRILPLAISAVYAVSGYFFLVKISMLNPLFYLLPLGTAGVLFCALFFTMRFQISIHMMAAGALTSSLVLGGQFLMANFELPIAISIIMASLIGFARISLNAHKPYQVYSGYVAGFMTQYFSVKLIYLFGGYF